MSEDPKQTTEYMLGQINTEIKAVKGKITEQNGSLGHVKDAINSMNSKISQLPCSVHEQQIDEIFSLAEQKVTEDKEYGKEKRNTRRELLIALISVIATAGTTLAGVWIVVNSSPR